MNKKKQFTRGNLVEIITPFDDSADEMGLYDDCPLCRELKAKIESGEAVPSEWDVSFGEEGKH
jgi:hypothetical protein